MWTRLFHVSISRRNLAALLVVLLTGGAGGWWASERAGYVFTDDARVAADMVTISAETAGQVIGVHAPIGARVHTGQALAQLDPAEAELAAQTVAFDVVAVEAQIARETQRRDVARRTSAARIARSEAQLAAARAEQTAALALLDSAEADHARIGKLQAAGLVTRPAMERASDARARARMALDAAMASVAAARSALEEACAAGREPDLITHDIEALQARLNSLGDQHGLKRLDLERHAILSPLDGVVDEVFVDVGERVETGQRVALMHDPVSVRIEGNVREPDIARTQPGAQVEVRFDAMPDRIFRGEVEQVRAIAANQLALLPAANPSGVFTKITQRVPIRVRLIDPHPPLRPGAMARLRIRAQRGDPQLEAAHEG